MTELHPVAGYLVAPQYSTRVVGAAYDALTPEDRRRRATGNPLSFLNVTRSRADLSPGLEPEASRMQAASLLRSWIEDGVFEAYSEPALYLYRLQTAAHVQTGVVGDISIESFRDGTVRRHEKTKPEKEGELVAFLETVGVSSSPISLTYRSVPTLADTVEALTRSRFPMLDFATGDGVRHLVWQLDGTETAELAAAFSRVGQLYITDGHHRAVAASRFAASHPQAERVLGVLFPSDQLRILPYNRCVKLDTVGLLELLGRDFLIEPAAAYEEARPSGKGQFAMFADGSWSRLSRRAASDPGRSFVEELDVSVLHRQVLAPLLENAEPDYDPRLTYVPGVGGPAALEARCTARGEVGFMLRPTSIEEVMAVSDAGETMPPKSTYFDPKPRSGIFLVFR